MFSPRERQFGVLTWGVVEFSPKLQSHPDYDTASFWLKRVAPHYKDYVRDYVEARLDFSTLYRHDRTTETSFVKLLDDDAWEELLTSNYDTVHVCVHDVKSKDVKVR
jgi:hypothetical protein